MEDNAAQAEQNAQQLAAMEDQTREMAEVSVGFHFHYGCVSI